MTWTPHSLLNLCRNSHANSGAWLLQNAPAGGQKKDHRRLKRALRCSLVLSVPRGGVWLLHALPALTHSVLVRVQSLRRSASEARDPGPAAGTACVIVVPPRRCCSVTRAFIPLTGTNPQTLEAPIQESSSSFQAVALLQVRCFCAALWRFKLAS